MKKLLTIPEIPHAGIILSYISTKPAPPEETFMMESGLLSLQEGKKYIQKKALSYNWN